MAERSTWPGFWPDDPREEPKRLTLVTERDYVGGADRPLESISATQGMKIAMIDIECSPNLAYAYQMWNTNITPEKLVEPQKILCFSVKWKGADYTSFYADWTVGEEEMLAKLHYYLDEAHALIHYNGERFDVPHINRELLLHGFPPPSPFKNIDLYRTVKKKFAFTYNGLDYVSKQLGLPGKTRKISFEMWVALMNGDPEVRRLVEEYNIGDVEALDVLHDRLLPWIHGHPSHAAFTGEHVCPNCGSSNLERRGYAHTAVSQYQRYVCKNCGKWSRGTKKIDGVQIREVAAAG